MTGVKSACGGARLSDIAGNLETGIGRA